MTRRSHFSSEPADERGSALTPQAMTKQEFGRRLQKLLHERHWRQSDLARAVEEKTGRKMGRDAISTYINGRSFPTPASAQMLCEGLGMTLEELFPNAVMYASDDEHPSFELKASGDGKSAWVRVNRLMSFATAAQIAQILNTEDKPGDD